MHNKSGSTKDLETLFCGQIFYGQHFLRLTVKILSFLRLTAKFLAVLRLTVNPSMTLAYGSKKVDSTKLHTNLHTLHNNMKILHSH